MQIIGIFYDSGAKGRETGLPSYEHKLLKEEGRG